MNEDCMRTWAKREGLALYRGDTCIQKLWSRKCDHTGNDCLPPRADHVSMWKRFGKVDVFVSQPYGMSWRVLLDTIEFCDKHKLQFSIDTWPAWHNPGSVLMVTYERSYPK